MARARGIEDSPKYRCAACHRNIEPGSKCYMGVAKPRWEGYELLIQLWCLQCGPEAMDAEGNPAKYIDPDKLEREWTQLTYTALCYGQVMNKLKRAAALLGKRGGLKGGKAKVPKGFSKTNPSEAGKRGMRKRWGKEVDITVRVRYLPGAERNIIEWANKLATLHRGTIQEAITICFMCAIDADAFSELDKAGIEARTFLSSRPRRIALTEAHFNQLVKQMKSGAWFFELISSKEETHGTTDDPTGRRPAAYRKGDSA